jgi:hypothetical protein
VLAMPLANIEARIVLNESPLSNWGIRRCQPA